MPAKWITLAVHLSGVLVLGLSQNCCHVPHAESSLTSALQQLSANDSNCSILEIYSGFYTISELVVLDNVSVSIRGVGSVRVTFDVADDEESNYSLLFRDSEAVNVSGIQFEYSAGVIGFVNVYSVSIQNSSFR